MSLDREQLFALAYAGTVGLPAPFPASGTVSLVLQHSEFDQRLHRFLKVVHNISPRLRISRLVEVNDIRVIQFMGPPIPAPNSSSKQKAKPKQTEPSMALLPGEWTHWMCDELHACVKERTDNHQSGSAEYPLFTEAIVFVPESAPVLMTVDVGVTAAESAEYYPPLTGSYDPKFCEGHPRYGKVFRPPCEGQGRT